jgi:acyl-coenzyme A synthetase/AMP-(fatty) acid ligase
VGGTTNLAYNCLDRHLAGPRADATAIVFEGEPGDVVRYTYRELHAEVCRMANALTKLGVVAGDRVGIYMGMVPEAAIGMLACARLGAVHTVIFGGFAAEAIRDRLNDAGAKVVLTQDSAWRRGARVPLKAQVDRAIVDVPSVQHVVVLQRMAEPVVLGEREHDWRRSWPAKPPRTRPRRSTPSTRSSSSTRRAPPGSPRACCTPRAATWWARRSPPSTCSTCATTTCTGAPPTWAG